MGSEGVRVQVREALHGHPELRAAPVQAPLLQRRLPALRPGALWQSPVGAAPHAVWGLLLFRHLHVCMCASHFSLAEKRYSSWHVCLHPPSGGCVRLQPCGRKLRCSNHLCPSPCHSGPCQPCPLSAPIACACGQTSYNTPCGTESAAKPPKCPEVRPASTANALCTGMGAKLSCHDQELYTLALIRIPDLIWICRTALCPAPARMQRGCLHTPATSERAHPAPSPAETSRSPLSACPLFCAAWMCSACVACKMMQYLSLPHR